MKHATLSPRKTLYDSLQIPYLIPLLALRGAAIATLITQFILMVLFWILGARLVDSEARELARMIAAKLRG